MYDKLKLESIVTDERFRAVDDAGDPMKPSHKIYEMISEEMKKQESNISKKHVYQILKTNRGGMLDKVLKQFNIAPEVSILENSTSSDLEYSTTNNDVRVICKDSEFKLVISNEHWTALKSKVKYDNRKCMVLKPRQWTNIFAQKIYEQTQIECAFTFKRAKVFKSKDAKCHSSFKGMCSECGASLNGCLYLEPGKKNDAIFECKLTKAPINFKHKKKRQLRGDLRSQVASELLDGKKSATEWRRQQASTIPPGKGEPPTIPNLITLRKAKQEELDKRLQLRTNNPSENLLIAKCETLPRTIKTIGLYPFYCYYWSDLQELLYKTAIKEDLNSELCIDATSSIANRLILPNGKKSPAVFLYSCVLKSKSITFPAFHMLTTKQDAVRIINFLMEIKKRVKSPHTVVSDFGEAILIAVAHVFAECANFLDYLGRCYQIVMSQGCPKLPTTFIRLDISHFVQMICKWPCFKQRLPKAREFTIRSLCHIYKCDDFREVESALRDLLTVLLSKDIGFSNETTRKLEAQKSLENLDKRIRGEVFEEYSEHISAKLNQEKSDFDDDIDTEDEPETEVENDSSNIPESNQSTDEENVSSGNFRPWKIWADELYEIASRKGSTSDNGTVVNAFLNTAAALKIKKKLMYNLPLWTGIMRSSFNRGGIIATSAPIESEFAAVKSIFTRQMRVDKFAILHMDYLENKVKLSAAQSVKASTKVTNFSEPKKSNADLTPVLLKNPELTRVDTHDDNAFLSDKENLSPEPNLITTLEAENFENSSRELPLRKTSTPLKMDLSINSSKSDSQNIEYNSLNEKENWRGKGKEDKELPQRSGRKRKYLSPNPTWDSTNAVTPIGLPNLLNGNICEPLYMKEKNVIVRNSCAIDSWIELVMNAITMFEEYKLLSKDLKIAIFQIAHKILQKGKIDNNILKDRATILFNIAEQVKSIFKISRTRKVHTIDAKCNVAHLAEILFTEVPSCTKMYECSNCLFSRESKHLALEINVDIILLNGIEHLQNAVDDTQNQEKRFNCQKCGTPNKLVAQYGPHVIIDTSLLTHATYIERLEKKLELIKQSGNNGSSEMQYIIDNASLTERNDFKVSNEFQLQSIPLTIFVNDEEYKIVGVIDYSLALGEHYRSYVWQNKWYLYDDCNIHRTLPKTNEKTCPHVLFYAR